MKRDGRGGHGDELRMERVVALEWGKRVSIFFIHTVTLIGS